jgi:hypothetical protein
VPVPSGENFDYRLENAGARPLAVEIYRLADGEEGLRHCRSGAKSLTCSVRSSSTVRSGYLIIAPQQFTLRKAERAVIVKDFVDEIVAAIQARPGEAKFTQGRWTIHKEDNLTGGGLWGWEQV